ncbi:MAG: transposase [Candidatus Aminicenantes bacterium]
MIQSFGSRINFHPHLHFLVTEGGTDKKGQFHRVPHFNDPLLCKLFTLKVFSLLLEKKLINRTGYCPLLRPLCQCPQRACPCGSRGKDEKNRI